MIEAISENTRLQSLKDWIKDAIINGKRAHYDLKTPHFYE
jgi:hypothetical protein